jgi:hypothetical protein
MIKTKMKASKQAIIVHGASEAEAIAKYTAVASGESLQAFTDGTNEFYTHASATSLYNPDTGDFDLDALDNGEFSAEASARTGAVDVFYGVCSDGCGEHVVADCPVTFCPSCSSAMPEEDEGVDLSDDEDLVSMEDEEPEEETEEEMDDVEYEDLEAEASEGMIVVSGDNLDEALENFRAVASNQSQRVITSGHSVFVTHASDSFDYDPLTGSPDIEEAEASEITMQSESSDGSDNVEAEHYICSDVDGCGAHVISTSSSVLNCPRCASGLLDPADFHSHSEDDSEDEELEALSAEIEELENELGISSESADEELDAEIAALLAESGDEEETEEEEEMEEVNYDDLEADLASDLEFEEELESESSDSDLDEDLDPDAEEDLSSDDILESESYDENDEFESVSADEDEEYDLDALDQEMSALDSDDMESESSDDIELDSDIAALLAESEDEEMEDDETEEESIEMDESEEESEEEIEDTELDDEGDYGDIEGLDLESESSESPVMEFDVDLLSAISATEDLSVDKFHVAHCGKIEGQSTWTAFYGKLPVAMASESSVADKAALKDIFESAKFGSAIMAHAKAEGIESALAEFNFERISPDLDVDAVVSNEIIKRSESRVREVETQMQSYSANVQAEINADMEHRMDRLMSALATSALGINRHVFANVRNPVADALISALSSAGVRNADSLVSDAFAQHGDRYSEILLGQARELLEKSEDTQDEITQLVVSASVNRGGLTSESNTVEDRLSNLTTVKPQTLQSESAHKPQTNRYLSLLDS